MYTHTHTKESVCIPQACGWAGQPEPSVTMTLHMALDLAKPREVFVSETDSHLCETLVASSYSSQH